MAHALHDRAMGCDGRIAVLDAEIALGGFLDRDAFSQDGEQVSEVMADEPLLRRKSRGERGVHARIEASSLVRAAHGHLGGWKEVDGAHPSLGS